MNFNTFRPGLKARAVHLSLAAASAAALLTSGVAVVTAMPAQAAIARDVAQALKLRLPKTPIDALDCTTFAPWCEVVSGESLFYIDEAARYLFVGRLYDLEERRDVTATRLLELNPDLLAAGAARAAGRAETHSPPRLHRSPPGHRSASARSRRAGFRAPARSRSWEAGFPGDP